MTRQISYHSVKYGMNVILMFKGLVETIVIVKSQHDQNVEEGIFY